MGKMAVKRLTGSDLTLFKWQFFNRSAGNQKSINLNADVFIDQLYPSLPNTDVGRAGRISLDMFLLGPGHAKVWNLQRKIIKGKSYKNWRLNGEFIPNPEDDQNRFNALEPNDYVIFDFEGEFFPTSVIAVFVANSLSEDAALHQGLADAGLGSMSAIDLAQLRLIVHASGTPESHPVYELLLDSAIEDASQGGIEGIKRLQSRSAGRHMTRAELERARRSADDIGRIGEELIDGYLSIELQKGRIFEYEWVAGDNAIAPYDFHIHTGEKSAKVEVKSTSGGFNQVMHISLGELIEMRDSQERYDLYRVFALDDRTAKLRIAEDVKAFATDVLTSLELLPEGVTADSVSVHPQSGRLPFGEVILVDVSGLEEDTEPAHSY